MTKFGKNTIYMKYASMSNNVRGITKSLKKNRNGRAMRMSISEKVKMNLKILN